MTAIIVKNNLEEDGPVVPPLHDNGVGYRYAMYFRGNVDIAFADSYADLMDVLIPGYDSLSDEDQALSRIQLAQSAAAQIQGMILAAVEDEEISDEEWAVLSAPRTGPQPRADWWTSEVPLVVVETAYQPFTDVPRPASGLSSTADASNLWWVRPAEDEELLFSLHEIGYIRLMENTDLGS